MLERDHHRRKVLWDAELRRECRVPIKCLVFDISAGGARIRTESPLPIGTTIDLFIERIGMFPAKVIWQRGQHTGLGFLEEGWTVQMRLADAPLASVVTDEPDRLATKRDRPAPGGQSGAR